MTEKRFSRRELLQLTGVGAGAAMLAACQVQPVVQTVEVAAPVPEGPAHLKFWYWWGGIWGEACTAFADKVMEDNDDIYIEPLPLGGRMERILAAFDR
ncbi:MAG: twin-arginine translocation signal domain-containing protein [Caldilineaceae bacterium]|nr:twin-arginine translocation signal domain-containing protein [Caldilineaceae bacterium]